MGKTYDLRSKIVHGEEATTVKFRKQKLPLNTFVEEGLRQSQIFYKPFCQEACPKADHSAFRQKFG